MPVTRRDFLLWGAAAGLAACSGQSPQAAEQESAGRPQAAAGPVRNVAVELFTSQGCSSCPPADALMERVAQEPGMIVLSRPVTYWDRLGWPDTFGRAQNDQLQLRYNERFQTGNFYTPQAVVQGRAELVGSEEQKLRQAIASARALPGPELRVEGDMVVLSGRAERPAEVRVVALLGHADVPIGRGENGGRRVRYTNVVLGEREIGLWRGGEARIGIPGSALKMAGADRHAVLVQEVGSGPILAAAFL